MKGMFFGFVFVLLITGCTVKEKSLTIENENLCSAPIATLYIGEPTVSNGIKKFELTSQEVKEALAESLTRTNCFMVKERSETRSVQDGGFLLDADVHLSMESEVEEKNIFKDEKRELVEMKISLHAYNDKKEVTASAKSSLETKSSTIIGIKSPADVQKDKKTILNNAVKQASVSLKNGFERH